MTIIFIQKRLQTGDCGARGSSVRTTGKDKNEGHERREVYLVKLKTL